MDADNYVSTVVTQSGEKIGLGIIRINSIPDESIIPQSGTEETVDQIYRDGFSNLLSEIYQNYRLRRNTTGGHQDVSLELLWLTKPVQNQPYAASMDLYIIVRAIDFSDEAATATVSDMLEICRATLELQKYEFTQIAYAELSDAIRRVADDEIRVIVKEEHLENLQNQIVPSCFSFDRLPARGQDLSRIVNILKDHPNSALSFQLIPTFYSSIELDNLDQMTQALETLNKGIMNQGIGQISFALAEKHAVTYKYYSQNKNRAVFLFNILIYGASQAVANISTRVYGQLSSSSNNSAGLKFVQLTSKEVQKDDNFYPLPWATHEILVNTGRDPYIWNSLRNPDSCYRLPYIITAEEASEFFRLPIGSDSIAAGLIVNDWGKSSRTFLSSIINAGDIEVGTLKSSSRGDTIGFSLKDLTKHMLVVGTPGSGKTTFSIGLLDRLWKVHGIPFLVIEPVKNEYRALVQSIPDLQIFTPGKNFVSPFVFNPFVPPTNVRLETYKSTLKTAFTAAVSMSTPLDKIFEDSINNCYSDFRWLDTYTTADKGRTFNITDFIRCFQRTFDEIGYVGEAKNIGRAGIVRLNSLVNLFDNYHSIPIEDLLSRPTVIELAAIENSDQKALIIALLLLSVLAYVNSNYVGEGNLKNVILLEEAHVLLDAVPNTQEGEANPSVIAQSLLKRMLAEIRAYGVGIVVADQSPRKVSTDVVGLTDIKLAFRLVEAIDKRILADSTNMNDTQVERLAKLRPGEAFLFFGKLDEPEEVKTQDYRLQHDISITLSDDSIRSQSTYWADKKKMLRPYPDCNYVKYCEHSCDFARRILARDVARRLFVRNFEANTADYEVLKAVFGKIRTLSIAELNDESFDDPLFACIKLQLLRRVKYGTHIKLTDGTIKSTLEKA
jgi:DNA helicase HerA-like ATPase